MIDNFVNSPNLPQEINRVQSTDRIARLSRKTKLFQLIFENPEYLPKERSTRGNVSRTKQVHDEEDDDENYEE